MQNLLKKAYELLKKDERLVSNEGELLRNKIQELSYKLDEKLIDLLYSDETIRGKFFKKINEVWLFDSNRFVKFINNKEFLPDSYTSFKNKIGLVDSKEDFIADKNDVVLNRPYKDCTLAGGQDTEDAKRDEIFYNEVLASDEIDRLLDPKVFTNFKKYDKDGEHEFTERTKDKNGDIKDNMIIKGNNLIALHSLKKKFAGKVKLIYIDPPYNTGNDGFNYNDKFNHSTWLTFMKNRLEVAKELLRDDGSIFVHCDDNEQAYLKILMDEIFGRENFIANLVRKVGVAVRLDAKHISKETDYILFYAKNEDKLYVNKESVNNMDSYPYFDAYEKERGKYKLNKLDRGSITYSKKMDYVIEAPDGTEIYPGGTSKENGWCWRRSKDKFERGIKNGFIEIKKGNNGRSVYFKQYQYVDNALNQIERKNPYKNLLIEGFNNEIGNKEIKELFGESNIFNYPKSEILMKRFLDMTTEEGDIVLDYHLGSGTTCAAAHKMGRQYIGIEQMDYIKTVVVERLKKVINGETGGITGQTNWNGGGKFIYMELKKNNENYTEKVKKISKESDINAVYEDLINNGFINYKLVGDESSKLMRGKLSFTEQKKFLIDILDKNTLYLNFSEILDKNHKIDEKEKNLNNNFYKNG